MTTEELRQNMEIDEVGTIIVEFFDGDLFETAYDAHMAGLLYVGASYTSWRDFLSSMKNIGIVSSGVFEDSEGDPYVLIKGLTKEGRVKTYGEFRIKNI